jgi:DNA-binding response OmpR family regulator
MDAFTRAQSWSRTVDGDTRPTTKTTHVLIVDDETELLQELHETLETAGFGVTTAASATEAFVMVRNDRSINIIVVDLLMPDLHGLAFIEKVRLLGHAHAIRFIAMTGRATVEDVIRAMHLGVRDFIRKPLSGEEIIAAIKRLAAEDVQSQIAASQVAASKVAAGEQAPAAPDADGTWPRDHRMLLDRLIKARREKAKIFAGDLVADPVWDMLLALARVDLDGKGIPTLTLSIEGRIPASSALRRISEMEKAGLIERRPDPDDRRCILVYLTDSGRQMVYRYLDQFSAML